MIIKAVDLGLMANHLPAHEGTMAKLNHFLTITNNPFVSQIIHLQMEMMFNHVQVMLQLMEPNQQNTITLPPLPRVAPLMGNQQNPPFSTVDRQIALEGSFTAKSMASENFVSAMAMKTPTVMQAHIEMALQNSTIAGMYDQLIHSQGWVQPPNASVQEQSSTTRQFQHLVQRDQIPIQMYQQQQKVNPLNSTYRQ